MKKFIVNHVWWMTLVIGVVMLIAHTFDIYIVKVDHISVVLLLVIFLSPFISAITRIRVGDFEAEIDPKEVQKIKDEVSTHAAAADADTPIQNPELVATLTSINELAESDPNLALAKLRIELEKALYRLYRRTHKEDQAERYLPPGQIVQILSNAEILPRDIARSLREVISICNRTIHGEEIRKEDAQSVIEAGVSLLMKLYFYASNYVIEPVETVPVDNGTLAALRAAQYRVTTLAHSTDTPYKNVRIVNQEGLDEFLEGYNEYGEFIIEVTKLDSKGAA